VLQADPMLYADGLDLSSGAPATPVGQACRVCVRRDCAWRQEDPIVDAGLR
jgi:predicted transcriptional regulator